MDHPWIIHGLSMDNPWIINPWIIHGLSMKSEIESGSEVVFESDVVYWVLTLSCKTKVIESGGMWFGKWSKVTPGKPSSHTHKDG